MGSGVGPGSWWRGTPMTDPGDGGGETPLFAIVVSTLIVAAAVVYVVSSLRRPELPSFAPTEPRPEEVGEARVGPVTYTVDASSSDRWVHFDFSRGAVVEDPEPLGWDLAFRRFHVIANGGAAFGGEGGIQAVDGLPLEAVAEAPRDGYVATEAGRDSVNPAMASWYDYSWLSHVLTPRLATYVVRTADGRYAKLQILGYYCPGARPGCITFRYVYQGDGSRRLQASGSSSSPSPTSSMRARALVELARPGRSR